MQISVEQSGREDGKRKREAPVRKFRCSHHGCGKKFLLQEYLDMHRTNFGHSDATDAQKAVDAPADTVPGGLLYPPDDRTYYGAHSDTKRSEFKNVCPLCNSSFIAQKNLLRHMESAHSNCPDTLGEDVSETENACKECGKRFSSRYNLERHTQLHLGVRYPCTLCGKIYTQKYAWGQHMKVSHKEWQGKSVCGQEELQGSEVV